MRNSWKNTQNDKHELHFIFQFSSLTSGTRPSGVKVLTSAYAAQLKMGHPNSKFLEAS